MLLAAERADVVRYAQLMIEDGLVVETSGNLSVRRGRLVVCTPSGLPYGDLTPERTCVHRLDGQRVDGELEPTSELPMHLAVYRGTAARAVVHTHPTAGTALSTLVDEVPSIHYLMGLFGGPVRVADYAPYGSQELATNVLDALADRTACLLANHGAVCVGADLRAAYAGARYLEWLCEVYLRARACGEPRLLPAEEIHRVAGRLTRYGRR